MVSKLGELAKIKHAVFLRNVPIRLHGGGQTKIDILEIRVTITRFLVTATGAMGTVWVIGLIPIPWSIP